LRSAILPPQEVEADQADRAFVREVLFVETAADDHVVQRRAADTDRADAEQICLGDALTDARDRGGAEAFGDLARERVDHGGACRAGIQDELSLHPVDHEVDVQTWRRLIDVLDRRRGIAEGPSRGLLGRPQLVGREGGVRLGLRISGPDR
jgi:hypothetical protein